MSHVFGKSPLDSLLVLGCTVCLCAAACVCFSVLVGCVCLVLELHVGVDVVFGRGLL